MAILFHSVCSSYSWPLVFCFHAQSIQTLLSRIPFLLLGQTPLLGTLFRFPIVYWILLLLFIYINGLVGTLSCLYDLGAVIWFRESNDLLRFQFVNGLRGPLFPVPLGFVSCWGNGLGLCVYGILHLFPDFWLPFWQVKRCSPLGGLRIDSQNCWRCYLYWLYLSPVLATKAGVLAFGCFIET